MQSHSSLPPSIGVYRPSVYERLSHTRLFFKSILVRRTHCVLISLFHTHTYDTGPSNLIVGWCVRVVPTLSHTKSEQNIDGTLEHWEHSTQASSVSRSYRSPDFSMSPAEEIYVSARRHLLGLHDLTVLYLLSLPKLPCHEVPITSDI